jgi:hypothetical protein
MKEIRNVWDVLRMKKINKRKVRKCKKEIETNMSGGESILNRLYAG